MGLPCVRKELRLLCLPQAAGIETLVLSEQTGLNLPPSQ